MDTPFHTPQETCLAWYEQMILPQVSLYHNVLLKHLEQWVKTSLFFQKLFLLGVQM